jgi:hypothetical protein
MSPSARPKALKHEAPHARLMHWSLSWSNGMVDHYKGEGRMQAIDCTAGGLRIKRGAEFLNYWR